jgi:prepilin-type N-terminal cleavage/methylation domain-containing protein
MQRRRGGRARGFTLTELMVVIVMISILSAIAYPSLRRRLLVTRGREGVALMQTIALAEEGYRSEHMVYLTASPQGAFYPATTPSGNQMHFRQPGHADYARWEVLAPELRSLTWHGFQVTAGLPGPTAGQFPALDAALQLPLPAAAPTAWFVIQGRADLDEDGTPQFIATSNLNPSLVTTDLGE